MWAHYLKKEKQYEECARMLTCSCRGQYKNRMPTFETVRKGYSRKKYCVSESVDKTHVLPSVFAHHTMTLFLFSCFHICRKTTTKKIRQMQQRNRDHDNVRCELLSFYGSIRRTLFIKNSRFSRGCRHTRQQQQRYIGRAVCEHTHTRDQCRQQQRGGRMVRE